MRTHFPILRCSHSIYGLVTTCYLTIFYNILFRSLVLIRIVYCQRMDENTDAGPSGIQLATP